MRSHVPQQLLGSLVVAVLVIAAGTLVTSALLPYRVPTDAVVMIGLAVMVLMTGVGMLLVSRRWPADTAGEIATGMVGPVAHAVIFLAFSTEPLWFRLVAALAFAVAGLLGIRAGSRESDAPPRPVRTETGSGSLEYVGIVILAAVLVVASVGAVASSSPAVRQEIWEALCKITGGECPAGESPTNTDYKPEDCELYTGEKRLNATVDVTFIRLGGGATIQRTEKSNGQVEITIVEEGRGGVVAAAGAHGGFRVGDTNVGFDWEAEAAATAGIQGGETYVFDNAEDADAFQGYLERETAEDIVTSSNPVLNAGNGLLEWATGEEPPDNNGVQKRFIRFDTTVEASANASAGYGAEAGVEGSAMVALGMETDRGADSDSEADDTTTVYYQIDWQAGIDIGLPVVKGLHGDHASSGVIKVTTDSDGNLTQVQFVDRAQGSFEFGLNASNNSVEPAGENRLPNGLESLSIDLQGGPNSSTVVTQTLDLGDPARQQAFYDWFTAAGGINAMTSVGATALPGVDSEDGDNITSLGDGEEFAELMAEQAQVSVVEYDGTTWGIGGGIGASLGAKVSVDVGYEDNDASAIRASYLGAPDASGNRTPYDLPECVA